MLEIKKKNDKISTKRGKYTLKKNVETCYSWNRQHIYSFHVMNENVKK